MPHIKPIYKEILDKLINYINNAMLNEEFISEGKYILERLLNSRDNIGELK